MNWIETILNKILWLWPMKRVPPWGMGVRFRYNPLPWKDQVWVQLLSPGVHMNYWWWDDMEVVSVQDRVHDLSSQPITTKDDVAVTFSVNFTFRVDDPIAAICNVHDFNTSLNGLAMTHCAQRIRDWTWKELLEEQKELERSLKGTMTTRAKKWGVEVGDVGITVLVKAKPIAWLNIA